MANIHLRMCVARSDILPSTSTHLSLHVRLGPHKVPPAHVPMSVRTFAEGVKVVQVWRAGGGELWRVPGSGDAPGDWRGPRQCSLQP